MTTSSSIKDEIETQGLYNYVGLHHDAEGLSSQEIGAGGTFWMVRHGEVFNPDKIFYGRMPRFHLSQRGFEEARETSRFLAKKPITNIYASPLLRAKQTAQVIAQPHSLKVKIDKNLLEVRTSRQGEPLANLSDFNFYEPLAGPNDETLEIVLGRVQKFVKNAMSRDLGKHIVAVSHGDPVVVFHAYYCNMPIRLASLRQPNLYPQHASVIRYDWPPEGFTLDVSRVRVSYFQAPFENQVSCGTK